jgi:hypothetical protein
MRYLDFLEAVHQKLGPETYLEIGVARGLSIARAGCPSIGVDPGYNIPETRVLGDNVQLARTTSDEFFAAPDPLAGLPVPAIDLSFIDGMHLYEFALRDFMNVEKHSRPGAVTIFDDMLPRSSIESQRNRETGPWTGDVWKLIPTLRELRPDLMCVQVNTQPTGLLMVIGVDADSTTLSDHYQELEAKWSGPDHVRPPAAVLRRHQAIQPAVVIDAPFWTVLRELREGSASAQDLRDSVSAWAAETLMPRQAKAVNPSFAGKARPTPPRPAKTSAAKKSAAKKAVAKKTAARKKATPPPAIDIPRIVRGLKRRVAGLRGR